MQTQLSPSFPAAAELRSTRPLAPISFTQLPVHAVASVSARPHDIVSAARAVIATQHLFAILERTVSPHRDGRRRLIMYDVSEAALPGLRTSSITIKKYANRRLYNTATSCYVTLDYLAQLVKTGAEFSVYDAKTGEDITRAVLTHIIVEEESKGQSMLPSVFFGMSSASMVIAFRPSCRAISSRRCKPSRGTKNRCVTICEAPSTGLCRSRPSRK